MNTPQSEQYAKEDRTMWIVFLLCIVLFTTGFLAPMRNTIEYNVQTKKFEPKKEQARFDSPKTVFLSADAD